MYNRYIPQSDGTYRRNYIPDPSAPPPQQPRRQPAPKQEPPSEQAQPLSPPPQNPPRRQQPQNPRSKRPPEPVPHCESAESFLRRLLPHGLDTGDLLVVFLLLLMAGDCQEDKNTMLLTLALYLFL